MLSDHSVSFEDFHISIFMFCHPVNFCSLHFIESYNLYSGVWTITTSLVVRKKRLREEKEIINFQVMTPGIVLKWLL